MKLLTDKYIPKKTREIKHNQDNIEKIKLLIKAKKNILLYGPTGTGKTIISHAIANDLNYEILELNASDIRNSESIYQILGNSINQKSLFNEGKLLLVDEIDGLSGNDDRGGIQAIIELLKISTYSIIMTCNNPYDQKLSSLRQKVQMIELKKLNSSTILTILEEINNREKLNLPKKLLEGITQFSSGDIRAAINDLQVISKKEDLELLGNRERKEDIFNTLKLIFKAKDPKIVLPLLEKVDMDQDEVFLWIDENIPNEYKLKEDLYNAYEVLSKADVFRGRIRRWQHWRFLAYINDLLTAGIALSKKEKYNSFTLYKRTTRILKLWKAKMQYGKRKSISEKLARYTHTSTKKVIKDFFYLKNIIDKDLATTLKLDEDEIDYLKL